MPVTVKAALARASNEHPKEGSHNAVPIVHLHVASEERRREERRKNERIKEKRREHEVNSVGSIVLQKDSQTK
jgi:hypothetical protein